MRRSPTALLAAALVVALAGWPAVAGGTATLLRLPFDGQSSTGYARM